MKGKLVTRWIATAKPRGLMCPVGIKLQESLSAAYPKTAQKVIEQVAPASRVTVLPSVCRKINQLWRLEAETVKMLILGNFLMKGLWIRDDINQGSASRKATVTLV